MNAKEEYICDGCNVRHPHEHRCHEHNIVIGGEFTNKDCECELCNKASGTQVKMQILDRLFDETGFDLHKVQLAFVLKAMEDYATSREEEAWDAAREVHREFDGFDSFSSWKYETIEDWRKEK